jgi:hypothetical protein
MAAPTTKAAANAWPGYFDGRDITDVLWPELEVRGYLLQRCRFCGTWREPTLPFCCELAPEAPWVSECLLA